MPKLLKSAIDAMTDEQASIAQALWATEPAMRTLMLLLESQHPAHYKRFCCPYCGNRDVNWKSGESNKVAYCKPCEIHFSATVGTPFFNLKRENYRGLYGTLLTLWGPWRTSIATKIAGCAETMQFADFRQRLQPLFAELPTDEPLASAPAYRLGFTPAQQGIRCLRCDSDRLIYRKRHNPANPTIQCQDCNYLFRLLASRRALLPLPPGLKCPECHGTAISHHSTMPDGRKQYRCRECPRLFVEGNKMPNRRRRIRATPLGSRDALAVTDPSQLDIAC